MSSQTLHRLPLNTLAVGFGLAGLAEAWNAAAQLLPLPRGARTVFWMVAAAAWIGLVVAHLARGASSAERLREQLRDHRQGPLAALVAVTAMLLGAELHRAAPAAGRIVVVAAVTAAAVFAAWLIHTWLGGGLSLAAVHGGYLLPTVAAGLVGADSAAAVGYPLLGWACFGVGAFFAVVMTSVVLARLALGPPLPAPLAPSATILAAPPAVAGLAWFRLTGASTGAVPCALAGVTVLLVLVQLAHVPRYARAPFSIGHWGFTFPAAASCAFALEFLAAGDVPGAAAVAAVVLALLTAFVTAIAVRTVLHLARRPAVTAAPAASALHPQ